MNADVSAQSPCLVHGASSGEGEAEGAASQFNITTGRLQPSGTVRVKMVSKREAVPYTRFSLDGPVGLKEGILSWDGQFDLSPLSSAEKVEGDPLPVVATGQF
ncbi:MAG: hypothetical protein R3D29_14045 [Nitratireductor sp.]